MIDVRFGMFWFVVAAVGALGFMLISVARWFSPALFHEMAGPALLAVAAVAILVALTLHHAQD